MSVTLRVTSLEDQYDEMWNVQFLNTILFSVMKEGISMYNLHIEDKKFL
jgi:hypothetical protein